MGNGPTTANQTSPVAVLRGAQAAATSGEENLTNVTAISASVSHSCAVAGGKAYCWGNGDGGRLGNGATDNETSPVAVTATLLNTSTDQVTAISAGSNHSCAVAGGKAYCWGNDSNGVLGNSATTDDQTSPVVVTATLLNAGTDKVAVISAGNLHSCAVASGKAYCWGSGDGGRLGNGAMDTEASPVAVNAFP